MRNHPLTLHARRLVDPGEERLAGAPPPVANGAGDALPALPVAVALVPKDVAFRTGTGQGKHLRKDRSTCWRLFLKSIVLGVINAEYEVILFYSVIKHEVILLYFYNIR